MNSNNISCDGNTIIVHAFYEKAHIILNKWIEAAALQYFQSRLTECFEIFRQKIQCQAPVLKMRKMKKRWGSMSAMRVMTLNLCLIFTDPQCIDYVIMHELCHIKHLNHGTQFHELQAYFTPNWKQIKKQLEEFVIV
jgi:predicted metal-dependent hydrolase